LHSKSCSSDCYVYTRLISSGFLHSFDHVLCLVEIYLLFSLGSTVTDYNIALISRCMMSCASKFFDSVIDICQLLSSDRSQPQSHVVVSC